jgi:hypothetical protein
MWVVNDRSWVRICRPARIYIHTYIYAAERESLKMSTSFFLVMVDRRQRRSALCQHYNLHTQSRRKVFYLTHFPMAPDEYKKLLLTFWLVFIIQNVSCFFFFCLFGCIWKNIKHRIDIGQERGAVGRGGCTVGRGFGRTFLRHGTGISRRLRWIHSLFGLSRSSARGSQG